MNEIEKEIDRLGRLVIPIEFRKGLGLEAGGRVLVAYENGTLTVRPKRRQCALCGEKIPLGTELRLCEGCIERIKAEK